MLEAIAYASDPEGDDYTQQDARAERQTQHVGPQSLRAELGEGRRGRHGGVRLVTRLPCKWLVCVQSRWGSRCRLLSKLGTWAFNTSLSPFLSGQHRLSTPFQGIIS
jgi:hypothetical protein